MPEWLSRSLMPPSRWPLVRAAKACPSSWVTVANKPKYRQVARRDGEHDGDEDYGEQFSNGHRGNLGPCKAGGNPVPPLLRAGSELLQQN